MVNLSHPMKPAAAQPQEIFCVRDRGHILLDLDNDPTKDMADAFDLCNESKFTSHIVPSPFNLLILCPRTLDFVAITPQLESTCLYIDLHFGRYIDNGGRISQTQMWTIRRHLAMLYTFAERGTRKEIYIEDVNKCTHLSLSDALISGANWAYYAASQSMATMHHELL